MHTIQRIHSPIDLEAFVAASKSDLQDTQSVQELTVDIDEAFPIATFRECLKLARHITDLYLHLPPHIPEDILDNIVFKNLEFLHTNLPHSHLVPFLAVNPRLNGVSLGDCQAAIGATCPLRLLSSRPFLAVECPSSCITGVAHSSLFRLAVHEDHEAPIPIPATLRMLRAPLVDLSRLTLDFAPDDYDILESIVPVAPRLQALKLLEKGRVYRRQTQRRRAWNDGQRWANSLARLDSLEEFALRTAATMAYTPSVAAGEGKVFMKWVARSSGRSSSKSTSQHPTLSVLRVWYHRHRDGDGVITMWSKSTGIWRNIQRTIHPPLGVAF